AVAPPLVADRDHADQQQPQDHPVDVAAEPRERLPEEVAETGDADHPPDRTDEAPQPELDSVHLADTGHQRHVGPNERDEPSDHQSLAPVLLEELDGPVEVPLLDDPSVVAAHGWTDRPADLVARECAGQ